MVNRIKVFKKFGINDVYFLSCIKTLTGVEVPTSTYTKRILKQEERTRMI